MTLLHINAMFLVVAVFAAFSACHAAFPSPLSQRAPFTKPLTLKSHLNNYNVTSPLHAYKLSEGCRVSVDAWKTNTYPDQLMMSLYSGQSLEDLGLFDSCEAMEYGHHCTAGLGIITGTGLTILNYGMCLPTNCTQEDMLLFNATEFMAPATQLQFYALSLVKAILPSPIYAACADQQAQWYDDKDAMTIVILIIILLTVVIIATVLDHFISVQEFSIQHKHTANDPQDSPAYVNLPNYANALSDPHTQHQNPSVMDIPKWKRFIHAFSAIRNVQKLIAPIPVSGVDMSCLNGVRVLSMAWVIIGHTALSSLALMRDPSYLYTQLTKRISFQVILEAFYAVDSFFFLSGFLAAYFLLKAMLKRPSMIKLLSGYYIQRWLRLTPIYMFWLFMFWKLMKYIGAGQSPLQFSIQGLFLLVNGDVQGMAGSEPYCPKYWWTNLLYINNFYPEHMADECMGWSWYLANDMQFSIILPYIIFLYIRWRIAGLTLILTLLTGSFTYVGVVSHNKHFTTMYADPNNTAEYSDAIYIKPYARIQPYLIGVLYAFLLHARPQRIPTRIYRPCMLIAAFLMAGLVFGPSQLYQSGGIDNWSRTTHDLYMATSRGVWAVGLGFLCYSMIVGTGEEPLLELSQPQHKPIHEPGSYLTKILGHPVWTPFARLSYQAYLVHEPWVSIFNYNMRAKPFYTDYTYAYWVLGHISMAFGLAFVGYLLIEKPLMNLTNCFMSWIRGEKSSKSHE